VVRAVDGAVAVVVDVIGAVRIFYARGLAVAVGVIAVGVRIAVVV
jgi:hypothetical protein